MKFARIIENVAVDVVDADPADLFHPLIAAEFVQVPDEVVPGSILVDGAWTAPPAIEEPAPVRVPVQMAVIDFLRLFTTDELAGFNALRKACQALAPADYLAAAEGDQQKAALVGFEVFLTFYDALRAGLIELNHPETIQGLSLLVPLDVLTPARLAQVLAGERP